MTIGEHKKQIAHFPDNLEIVIRCEWDGQVPNGTCFALRGATVEDDHSTGEDFAAFDCDQEMEDG